MISGLDRDEFSLCKQAPRDCATSLALGFDEDNPSQSLRIDDVLSVRGNSCHLTADVRILRIELKPPAKRE